MFVQNFIFLSKVLFYCLFRPTHTLSTGRVPYGTMLLCYHSMYHYETSDQGFTISMSQNEKHRKKGGVGNCLFDSLESRREL